MKVSLSIKIGLIFLSFLVIPLWADAAVLFVEPSSGAFQVGSAFETSLYLDTEGKSVNAVSVKLFFPPDKLQVTNPSFGQSVVGIWSEVPTYNNQKGTIEFVGAIPKGITASRALLATISLRAKSVGDASMKILGESQVLLNDGKGTNALKNVVNSFFKLILPPPAGPDVFSPTHPDQDKWYKEETVSFLWESDPAIQGYSYILNELPIDSPDSVSEGNRTSVLYKDLESGVYYFHIKALRAGVWGGVTHYSIRNDREPPAVFSANVLPGDKTVRRQPILQFQTSDAPSGLSHYELKLVRLSSGENVSGNAPLFFEVQSPYVTPELELGSYDAIIRAIDHAGNLYDSVKHFEIVETLLGLADEGGVLVRGNVVVSWGWIWTGLVALLLLLFGATMGIRRWHHSVDLRVKEKRLPDPLSAQLEELKKYRDRYGKIMLLVLSVALSSGILVTLPVYAEEMLPPPVVSALSKNMSDDELFYITGTTKLQNSSVVVFIQNAMNGTIVSKDVLPDEKGEWFYQNPIPFEPGEYIVWLQTRLGDLKSSPTAQHNVSVAREAFRLGSSRISYETVYLYISLALLLGIIGMAAYVAVHGSRAHKKRKAFLREVREAEESIVRGFAVLRRDIQAELALVRKAKMSRELSEAERAQEEHLMKDLAFVEQHVKKEVWDLEHIRQ